MKLHQSVVDHLLYLVRTYSGFKDETKLRVRLEAIDLTPYERKTTPGQEIVLVLTEELMKQLSGAARRQ